MPTAEERAAGQARYEVTIDGWVLQVRAEPQARAALRERARRGCRGHAPAHVREVVRARIPGRVVRLWVEPGQQVEAGERLLAVEAMKMENEVRAPRAGTVASISVQAGPARGARFGAADARLSGSRRPAYPSGHAVPGSGPRTLARHDPRQGRRRAGRAARPVPDHQRPGDRRPLHARGHRRPGRGPRPRPAGRVPVHPRRPAHHVPRPLLDHAPVRRLRHRRRHQRALPLPARAGPDRASRWPSTCPPRWATTRTRPRPSARSAGSASRSRQHRGHGDPPRRAAARRGDHLDDHQRHGGHPAGLLRGRRGCPRHPAEQARRHAPERHPQGVHRARDLHLPDRGRPCGWSPTSSSSAPTELPRWNTISISGYHMREAGRDRRPGAGLHARRRHRLRGCGARARAGHRRVRRPPELLLRRLERALRGGRQVPGRAAHVGAPHARPLRGHGTRAP